MRQSTRSLWRRLPVPSQLSRAHTVPARQFTNSTCLCRAFQADDVVILRDKKNAAHEGTLTKLKPQKTTSTHRGVIRHDDIIGKQPRQLVSSSKGTQYRVHEPTLAEYVRLTPRMVTPIYPHDANLIVSLYDIHVDTYGAHTYDDPPFEILEAGTGHGALTLHFSRAIHAANPPFPATLSSSKYQSGPEEAAYNGESVFDLDEKRADSWKASRRAVLHTLDISAKHSRHARQIVKGFRHGMYARNVDFHVGDVSAWIASQKVLRKTEEPFLSHVFLDLPGADRHLANVASALRVNGIVGVFNPSITQVADCVEMIRKHRLPYLLDQVVELGVGTMRLWDVRAVTPRATLKKVEESEEESESSTPPASDEREAVEGQKARDEALVEELEKQKESVMVCRPKVGETVVGGGFLGLWRRMEPAPADEPAGSSESQSADP